MKKDALINTIFFCIVIAILTALYLYTVFDKGGSGQAKVTHDFIKIEEAVNNFKLQTNEYPSQNKGLNSLLDKPGEGSYKGPLLNQDSIVDPWGKKYIYENQNNTVVYIGSAGPDKTWESSIEDVLSGKLIGDDRVKIIKSH